MISWAELLLLVIAVEAAWLIWRRLQRSLSAWAGQVSAMNSGAKVRHR